MSVLSFRDIHRAYNLNTPVLSGVTFNVSEGEVVGLLGRNGAGKTTLIRILMGMIHPQRGEVRVFGMAPFDEPVAIKRRLGYVSEDQILPGSLRVDEAIAMHRGLFPTWDDALESELRRSLRVPARSRIRALSKGQARQVALLCAVAHRPELLILDEPAGGLDPAARREFLETAIRLLSESGTTIVFSSHHMTDVERIASRVVMIDKGALLLDEALDDLRENYSLAVLPTTARAQVELLDACVSTRERGGVLHAVLRLAPDKARERLDGLGASGPVTLAPLEDLFVELVDAR